MPYILLTRYYGEHHQATPPHVAILGYRSLKLITSETVQKSKDKRLVAWQQTQVSVRKMKGGSKEEWPIRCMLHVNIETNIK